VSAMPIYKTIWLLVLPMLVSALAGCDSKACDSACPLIGWAVTVDSSDVPVVQLSVSGVGCQSVPTCVSPADGGGSGCAAYSVGLTQAGACHITATTADGRQATADLTVRVVPNSCCGDLTADPPGPVTLTFAPAGQGGSASEGG
jgi:hypothetical protein